MNRRVSSAGFVSKVLKRRSAVNGEVRDAKNEASSVVPPNEQLVKSRTDGKRKRLVLSSDSSIEDNRNAMPDAPSESQDGVHATSNTSVPIVNDINGRDPLETELLEGVGDDESADANVSHGVDEDFNGSDGDNSVAGETDRVEAEDHGTSNGGTQAVEQMEVDDGEIVLDGRAMNNMFGGDA